MSLLIKNGRIVTATDDYCADLFVESDTITLIGRNLVIDADEIVDAAGKLVIPGGIDPHTHLEMPFGGTTTSDDFETGTRAAAHGGTTCLIDLQFSQRVLRPSRLSISGMPRPQVKLQSTTVST